ncbi:MAG: orotidine-5'-phosphate decarboxylase [Acidobacteria bacterium]|nr:orotidine-5'-phosphate decarboxylase [Acidobacteriota bacterium]
MNRVIVALDVETGGRAMEIVRACNGVISFFKVGKQLFTAEGPDVVRRIKKTGSRVFLDLKYHDIPNTVAQATVEAVKLGADIIDIHTSGGYEMMKKTMEAVRGYCAAHSVSEPEIFGITILTSLDDTELKRIGYTGGTADMVARLAVLGREAGINGVVCSPLEISMVKKTCGSDFKTITPGIRPLFAQSPDDQKRVMTPKNAFDAGTDYIVMGRPITKALNIGEALRKLGDEIG